MSTGVTPYAALTAAQQDLISRMEPQGNLRVGEILNAILGAGPHHRQVITNPATLSNTGILNAYALTTALTITSGFTQPDVPRAFRYVTTAGQAGVVTVTGTDINDESITESITLNGTTPVLGTRAFKTIVSIAVPADASSGHTVSIGTRDALGMDSCLQRNTIYRFLAGGTSEAVSALTTNATEVSKNLLTPTTACDGAVDYHAYFIVERD